MAPFGAALFLLVAFVVWVRRTEEPLIALPLLAKRTFAAANMVNLLTGIILMAVMVEVPVLLQAVSTSVEAATAKSGWLLAIFASGMVFGALVGGNILRRLAARTFVLVGLLIMIAGLWQMAQWNQEASAATIAAGKRPGTTHGHACPPYFISASH